MELVETIVRPQRKTVVGVRVGGRTDHKETPGVHPPHVGRKRRRGDEHLKTPFFDQDVSGKAQRKG